MKRSPRQRKHPGRAKRAAVISPAAQHVAAKATRKPARPLAELRRENPDRVNAMLDELVEILGVVPA
jgi:hypothetical protein